MDIWLPFPVYMCSQNIEVSAADKVTHACFIDSKRALAPLSLVLYKTKKVRSGGKTANIIFIMIYSFILLPCFVLCSAHKTMLGPGVWKKKL